MKPFHLFAGYDYYPGGGLNDYRGSFETLEAAQATENYGDWAHIVQCTDDGLVEVSERRPNDEWVAVKQPNSAA